MAGNFEIHIRLDGVADRAAAMRRIETGIQNLRPLWKGVSRGIYRFHRDKFRKEGWNAFGTARWQPLAEPTVAARARGRLNYGTSTSPRYSYHYSKPSKEGPRRRVLRWTNALMDSVTGKRHHIESLDSRQMEVGSRLTVVGRKVWSLAAIHHFGAMAGTHRNIRIPPRPIWQPAVNFQTTVVMAGHFLDALITDRMGWFESVARRHYLDPRTARKREREGR